MNGAENTTAGHAPPMLVTRPEAQAAKIAGTLASQGWAPVCCPLLTFRALPAMPDYARARGLVFTSANGVRAAQAPGRARDLPVYCVGAATAETARAAGFRDLRIGDGDAAALARRILDDQRHDQRGGRAAGPILHLRATHGTGRLAEALAAGGMELIAAPVYEMIAARALNPETRAALAGGNPVAAMFYSPRTARIFGRIFARLAPARHAPLHAIAISVAASESLSKVELAELRVAKTPTGSAMLEASRSLLRQRFAQDSEMG